MLCWTLVRRARALTLHRRLGGPTAAAVLPPGGRALAGCRLCTAPPQQPAGEDASSQHQHQHDEEASGSERQLKWRILQASLPFVAEKGWNTETLAIGAESLGLPDVAHGMFPRGGVELVDHFYTSCNAQLERLMAERRDAEQAEAGPARLGSQAFIRWAVERRLSMVTPYLARWPEALAVLAMPHNLPASLRNFTDLLDDVWYHAGDRSSDFNWYTKRAILAGVYKSTELRLLTDSSQDFSETWAFLDRRLEDAVSTGRCLRQMREAAPQAGHTAGALLTMASSILGLNGRR